MSQFSADLLAQSRHLATRSAKKPKQADLRRAISAAYYSLFHFLIHESSRQVAGSQSTQEDLKQLTSRAFEHGKMKEVCAEFKKAVPKELLKPFWSALNVPAHPDLARVADTFITLQDLRHQADYDLSITFSKQEALDAHQRAENAIRAWNTLKSGNRSLTDFFGLVLLIWPQVSRRK